MVKKKFLCSYQYTEHILFISSLGYTRFSGNMCTGPILKVLDAMKLNFSLSFLPFKVLNTGVAISFWLEYQCLNVVK